jgi:Ca-activated chloride channel family protein
VRRRFFAFALCFLFSLVTLPAAQNQSPATPAGPTFRTGIDLVALSVTVIDQQQKYVGGLTSQDFQVFEDGVMQDVSFFSASQTPLDLAVLIDTSASMAEKLPLAQTAASGLIHALHGGDRAAVIDLKDRVNVAQPFTTDLEQLDAAIHGTAASGGTALYNGVYIALKQFAALTHQNPGVRRQAIVVLSDGEDTASLLSFDDVLEQAKRTGVSIYTVALRSKFAMLRAQSTHSYFSQSDYSMKTLALETGARSFFPLDARELPAIYASIGEELGSQYAIGYQPHNTRPDGMYRKVIVRVVNRPDARPRTRTGYFASSPVKVAALPSVGGR